MTQSLFDSHLHVIDPAHPLVENNGFMPNSFTVGDYRDRIEGLGIAGGPGAPGPRGPGVPGSFQAFDQGYLVDAPGALGPSWPRIRQR